MNEDKIKAYSYIRMSTSEQLKGDSQRRQYEAIKKYAEKENLELQPPIQDIGVSAFQGDNVAAGKLGHFLHAIESGTIESGSFLIMESLDRLSRDQVLTASSLLTKIMDAGIVVVTLADKQKYSMETVEHSPFLLFTALGSMMRAHDESNVKAQRMKSAWSKKREDIQSGKITKQRIPGWLEFSESGNELVPITERVELLKEIFALSRDGYGAYSITRQLNERREKPWGRGKQWGESYIKKILSNRAVLGEFQPMKISFESGKKRKEPDGDLCPAYYPQVISTQLFSQANLAISQRKVNGSGRKGRTHRNIFTGFLRCQCGAGLRFIDKGSGSKGGLYLRCARSLVKGVCGTPARRYRDVEPAILEAIKTIDFEAILSDTSAATQLGQLKAQESDVRLLVAEKRSNISNLLDLVEKGETPSPPINDRINERISEQDALIQQLADIRAKITTLENFQPQNLQNVLDELNERLSGDASEAEGIRLRKKLTAELGYVVDQIKIVQTAHEPWELADENPEWYQNFGITFNQFERLCERFSFEVQVFYKNGAIHVFDPLLWESLPLDSSSEFKSFKFEIDLSKLS